MSDNPVPADLSLVPVLGIFEAAGWSVNHVTRPNGMVKCGDCSTESAAADIRVDAVHRIEGASDPDDMQTVLGFGCPSCGAAGALVASHGAAASEQDHAFLGAVSIDADDIVDPVAGTSSGV